MYFSGIKRVFMHSTHPCFYNKISRRTLRSYIKNTLLLICDILQQSICSSVHLYIDRITQATPVNSRRHRFCISLFNIIINISFKFGCTFRVLSVSLCTQHILVLYDNISRRTVRSCSQIHYCPLVIFATVRLFI